MSSVTQSALSALPLHRPYGPPVAFSHADAAGGERAGAPRRVLVVEDDFLVAGELEHCLTAAGFQVIGPAATAEEAIALAADGMPDLIIMDVRLAGPRDGVEAAIHIYKHFGVRSMFATEVPPNFWTIKAIAQFPLCHPELVSGSQPTAQKPKHVQHNMHRKGEIQEISGFGKA